MGGRLRRPLPHSAKPNAARRALPPLAARAKRGVCRSVGGVGGIESRGVRELPHTAAFSMPNFPNCTAKRRVNLTPQNRERRKIGDLSSPRRPARRVGCPLRGQPTWAGGFAARCRIRLCRMRRAAHSPTRCSCETRRLSGAGVVGGIESRGVRELPHTAAFSMPNFRNCTAKRRVNLTPQNWERRKIGDLSYPRRPARRVGCPRSGQPTWAGGFAARCRIRQSRMRRAAHSPTRCSCEMRRLSGGGRCRGN